MRASVSFRRLLLVTSLMGGFASTALAFNPNDGADSVSVARYQPIHRPLPASVVPPRYYEPVITSSPNPVTPAAAMAAPAPVAVTAAVTPVPIAAAPAYGYVEQQPPAPQYMQTASAQKPAYRANRFALGLEAFYDHYEEPDTFPDLNERAFYGSIDLGYEHYFSPQVFAGLEQRVSRGEDRYKSSQGSIDDIPQWEYETRLTTGYDANNGGGQHIKPYIGLGGRYFLDQSKGKVTTGGASAYERRILQLYLPIGVTYEFPAYGLTFWPNIEVDPLLYGHVESRLQNIPGGEEFDNRQDSGVGLRAEFLMGKNYPNGFGWQFGPFIRYWDISDSKTDENATGIAIEPRNKRIQAGAKLKVLF